MKNFVVLFFSFLLFLLAKTTWAEPNILVSQFYALGSGTNPDWVEIYNSTDNKINLEGWVIRNSTDSNKISLTGYICPKNYRKFEFSNILTNSGDKIRLLDSDSASMAIDELEYFSNSIPIHKEGESTQLNLETKKWTVLTTPNPMDDTSCNESAQPQNNASPTQTPSPKPSSPSSTTSKSPSPKPTDSQTKNVLGEKTENSTPSANLSMNYQDSPSPAAGYTQESSQKIAGIFIGVGSVLIAISAVIYLWYKRQQDKPTINKEKDRFEENKIDK